jgi:hypothetical protein
MKDLFDLKVNGNGKKDPLDISLVETGKSLVKGAIVLGLGIPILLGITDLVGGAD